MTEIAASLEALERLTGATYTGGYGGTCYQCPYASKPLRFDGSVADWHEVANDPTEAYFTCSLPTRKPTKAEWGEYAPCTADEWSEHHTAALRTEAARLAVIEFAARSILPEVMDEEIGSVVAVDPIVAVQRMKDKADRWSFLRQALGVGTEGRG